MTSTAPRRSAASCAALLLAAAALVAPARAPALEPRFDHRDQQGVVAALELWRDAVSITGRPNVTEWHPRLRLAWTIDVDGNGGELIVGGRVRADGFSDPRRDRFQGGLDARYRGSFGTEELKTFFELGLWSELRSRVMVGPELGVGLQYDPSRAWGLFGSLGFAAGVGQARSASFGASAGVQVRFE